MGIQHATVVIAHDVHGEPSNPPIWVLATEQETSFRPGRTDAQQRPQCVGCAKWFLGFGRMLAETASDFESLLGEFLHCFLANQMMRRPQRADRVIVVLP